MIRPLPSYRSAALVPFPLIVHPAKVRASGLHATKTQLKNKVISRAILLASIALDLSSTNTFFFLVEKYMTGLFAVCLDSHLKICSLHS